MYTNPDEYECGNDVWFLEPPQKQGKQPEDADPQPSQLLGPVQRCVLLSLSLPVLYDRYQDQVDDRLGNLSIEWSNAHDSIVLNSYLQKTFGLALSTTTKAMA
ncbi:hypothetical protein JHK87_042563 [Glycine soja]|nr:hypothetical protein JHK87_042563 [Glycine soja]